MFIRNQWYAAGWDGEVGRKPLARTICGEPLVLYRRLDGSPVAMRDACPHRLLPLSMGVMEGDNIRCMYHGFMFDGSGTCVEAPASGMAAKNLKVQAYPVVERYRFVWVWIGEADKADPALLPDLWQCEHPDWTFDGGHYQINCDYRLAIDNLMDLTHETTVHGSSIGQPEIQEAPIETYVENNRVYVRRMMADVDAPPLWRYALRKEGKVDRWQICEFILPSVVIIDVGVAPVGTGALDGDRSQGVNGYVVDLMTPETEGSHHYFWGMARNFLINDAGFTQRFKEQQGGVFLEDREVLEAQQISVDRNPQLKLRAFNIDVGGVRARMLIDHAIRADTGDDQAELVEG